LKRKSTATPQVEYNTYLPVVEEEEHCHPLVEWNIYMVVEEGEHCHPSGRVEYLPGS